jgi:putative hydrolase of the HAD superfamily
MIRNILFDLGGVLYDIDPSRTRVALMQLVSSQANDPHALPDAQALEQTIGALAGRYERGELSTLAFLQGLRSALQVQASDDQLAQAWNAMLIGPSHAALALLDALPQSLRLALLSNTSELHHRTFLPSCDALLRRFERCFYSFKLGHAKPDPILYERVLGELRFVPRETLVVDDLTENLAAAQRLGAQVLWVQSSAWPDQLVARLRLASEDVE